MHGQHRPESTTPEDGVKGCSETTNEPSLSTLNLDRSVWWSALWEFNQAILHINNVPRMSTEECVRSMENPSKDYDGPSDESSSPVPKVCVRQIIMGCSSWSHTVHASTRGITAGCLSLRLTCMERGCKKKGVEDTPVKGHDKRTASRQ